MIGNEDRVLADRLNNQRRKYAITTPRDNSHTLTIVDFQLHRCLWMNLDVRLGTLLDEKSDTSRLIAGEILIDNASASQNQRKLSIGCFLGRLVINRVKLSFTIRMIETLFEQTRRTWMILRRTRPKDPVLLFDFLPRDAVVVG